MKWRERGGRRYAYLCMGGADHGGGLLCVYALGVCTPFAPVGSASYVWLSLTNRKQAFEA
jgi:hypothetical protein